MYNKINVILYSFGKDSNITYSINVQTPIFLEYSILQKTIYFSYFLEYDGNVLKIDQWSLFQTSSCIAKPKWKSLQYQIIDTIYADIKAAQSDREIQREIYRHRLEKIRINKKKETCRDKIAIHKDLRFR